MKIDPKRRASRPAKPTTATKNKTKLNQPDTHRNEISDGIMDYVGWTNGYGGGVFIISNSQAILPVRIACASTQKRDLPVETLAGLFEWQQDYTTNMTPKHFFGLDCRPLAICCFAVLLRCYCFFFCQRCRPSSSRSSVVAVIGQDLMEFNVICSLFIVFLVVPWAVWAGDMDTGPGHIIFNTANENKHNNKNNGDVKWKLSEAHQIFSDSVQQMLWILREMCT